MIRGYRDMESLGFWAIASPLQKANDILLHVGRYIRRYLYISLLTSQIRINMC